MSKRLTQGISFFMTEEMYQGLRQSSEKREISVSQLLRTLIREYLRSRGCMSTESTGINAEI